MTREDAIKTLKELWRETNDTWYEEVYKMAINALEANRKTENCSEFPNNCDEPQTERIKTLDYCDICNHKGCDNCIANNLDEYCVPSGYEPTTQMKTQNSNLTFEKDECAKEYEELGLKELKELINADRKTEPSNSEIPNNSTISKMEQVAKDINVRSKDEPQTERSE